MSAITQFSSAGLWTLSRIPPAVSLTVSSGASMMRTIAPIVAKTLYTTGFVMYHASKMIPPTLKWLCWASKKAFVGARMVASCAVQLALSAYSFYTKNGGSNNNNKIPATVEQIETEEEQKDKEEDGNDLAEQVESLSAENEALKAALAELKLINAQQNKRIAEQQGQLEQVNQLVATLQAELVESNSNNNKNTNQKTDDSDAVVEQEESELSEVSVESELSSIPVPPPLPMMMMMMSARRHSVVSVAAAKAQPAEAANRAVIAAPRPSMADLVSGRSCLKKQEMPAFTVSERKEAANKNKHAEQYNELGAALLQGFEALNLKALRGGEEAAEEAEEDW